MSSVAILNAGDIREMVRLFKGGDAFQAVSVGQDRIWLVPGDPQSETIGAEYGDFDELPTLI